MGKVILAILGGLLVWKLLHFALLAVTFVVRVIAVGFVVLGDSLAVAIAWPATPVTGWIVLGLLIGGIAGAVIGLGRAGRPISRRMVVTGGVAATALLLFAGSVRGASATASARERPAVARREAPRPVPTLTTGGYARVVPENANVRDRAWPSATVLGTLPRGTLVRIVGFSADRAWCAVLVRRQSESVTGWISRSLLEPIPVR